MRSAISDILESRRANEHFTSSSVPILHVTYKPSGLRAVYQSAGIGIRSADEKRIPANGLPRNGAFHRPRPICGKRNADTGEGEAIEMLGDRGNEKL